MTIFPHLDRINNQKRIKSTGQHHYEKHGYGKFHGTSMHEKNMVYARQE